MISQHSKNSNVSHLDEIADILVTAIKRAMEREKSINAENSLDSLSLPSVHAENNNNGEF